MLVRAWLAHAGPSIAQGNSSCWELCVELPGRLMGEQKWRLGNKNRVWAIMNGMFLFQVCVFVGLRRVSSSFFLFLLFLLSAPLSSPSLRLLFS